MLKEDVFWPYFLGAIFGAQVLLIWWFSSLAIENQTVPEYFEWFIKSAITISAMLIGVVVAYFYRRHETSLEIQKGRVELINDTLITLSRQHSISSGLSKRVSRVTSSQVVLLADLVLPNHSNLVINISNLSFFLEDNNEPFILSLIDNEHFYHDMLASLKMWNDFYNSEVKTVLTKHDFTFDIINFKEKVTIDRVLKKRAEMLFSGLVLAINKFRNSSNSVIKELQILSNKKFPDEKFIRYRES